jgi:hypothetical protein
MPSGNLEGIALVGRASCGEFGTSDSERLLFLTRDGGSPNLVYFDEFACDCSGAVNETEFDICAAQGDLSGGCVCLDSNFDGAVDCSDFDPPISAQCEEPEPVPALADWGRGSLALLMLLVFALARAGRASAL